MKRLRSVIFWCHLVVGAAAVVVVLIMSVTGVLLTYQRQIQLWADTRGLDAAPATVGSPTLPVADLLAAASATRAGNATAVRWRADDSKPVEVVFGRDGVVYVNAFTGAVLGTGSEGTRAFFRSMTEWHRWLAIQGDERERGKAITGAANLAFLFIIVSGMWLWWPRRWNAAALRNITVFRRGLRPRARDFNWHNVVGFWSLVPLFVVVATAVVISYPWASDLVYRAVGEEPPAAPARAQGPAAGAQGAVRGGVGGGGPRSASLDPAHLDAAIAHAKLHDADWRIVTMQLAPAEGGAITFSIDRGDGGQPQKRGTLVLSAAGETLRWEPFAAGTTGRRLRSLMRFAHTGEVFGIVGQTIAGLVSAAAVLLVWTGVSLSLRRLAAWLRRQCGAPSLDVDPAEDLGDAPSATRPHAAVARRRRRKEYSQVA